MTNTLDRQINRFGFWSALIVIVTTAVSFVLPFDVPGGFDASEADRVAWITANRDLFIAGWVNQIAAMFSLSAVLFCGAWLAAKRNLLAGLLAAFVVAMATMAFIIPKFMAVWTIPLLADSISSSGAGAQMAATLLPLLNVSIPFSLYTSFDYLGFWLYSVFGLIAARPLYDSSMAAKAAAISLGSFGVTYQVLLASLLAGAITAAEIETYFLGVALLLLVHVVPVMALFRRNSKAT